MRMTTNSFGATHYVEDMEINSQLIEGVCSTDESDITQPIGQDVSGNPVYTFQGGNISLPGVISTSPTNLLNNKDYTYSLNDSYVFTSFKTGWMFLAYEGLPVNCDGFPMIPDLQRYKEAVKSFIRMKIDYILWRTGEIDDKVFKYSEQEWLFYVGSAANSMRNISKDAMNNLLNQIRLIPQKYSSDSFYRNLGRR